jgi:hypothetical protein
MSFTRSPGYSTPGGFRVTEPGNKGTIYRRPPLSPLPGEVTGLAVYNITETSIIFSWDPAPYASSYLVETTPFSSPSFFEFYEGREYVYFNELPVDTEYTYTITPVNEVGNGPQTPFGPLKTLLPIPPFGPAPFNTFTDVTKTTIGLSWYDDVVPYAQSYNIYAYTFISDVLVGVQNTPTSPYIYTGLQPNYNYYFKITAVNSAGESEPGAACVNTWTVPEVTGFSVGNPTETTVDLTWDAPDNSSSYNIQWIIETTPTTPTQTPSATGSFPIPYTFTGLTPDTEYTFTITPQILYDYSTGDPVTSDPIRTLLPLPGDGNMNYPATNVTATSMEVSWQPADYASSYDIYADGPDGRIGPISVTGTTYTFTGLTPDSPYSFGVAPMNATGGGTPSAATPNENTLIQTNLTYTGTIETLALRTGNYRFQMAGGSGPLRVPFAGGGRCFSEITFDYTVTSPITIQYAIGQASPGDVGGAGGTYMYDQTNSQWLFVAGGAGSNDWSPIPFEGVDPGDGSGGAAGSGGGSGAGVNSNGSDSTVSAGSGGLTYGNGGTGGTAGTFGDGPQPGGFGGGGGGTLIYDPALPPSYGEYAYYPGGGGGYTGGTTDTAYTPGTSTAWFSGYGTSYAIAGATFGGNNSQQGGASVTNGYININPSI